VTERRGTFHRVCRRALLTVCCLGLSSAHGAAVVERPLSESAERHLPGDRALHEWSWNPEALAELAGDRMENVEVEVQRPETVKLKDLVPPITFPSGVAAIPDATVTELRAILDGMRDRRNVRLNLVGHADNQPLSGRLAAIYGDNFGLSRERAGEVAESLQAMLGLPADAVSYEWYGATRPVASNDTAEGRARNRRVDVEVWYDELVDAVEVRERKVPDHFQRQKVCRIERVCKLRYREGHDHRARVLNLVDPLRYEAATVQLTDRFVDQIRETLAGLQDRQNLVVKFIGHSDDRPLPERFRRIYGNHTAFSRARARRVALSVQEALGLPSHAVDSDGMGTARPVASNASAEGQALNRRVEVEIWYDDPLQDLPEEPQLCPGDPRARTVTRVYDPTWGRIPPLALQQGQPVIPDGYAAQLRRAMADISERDNVRLRVLGYTGNERLDRRTAGVYGDDIGLSAARARRTMEILRAELELPPHQAEFEGRGYVHADDVINAGFVQDAESYVAVEVVYDEAAVLDDYEGVAVTPLIRELEPAHPFALNLMRITVDGEPIDDLKRSSADVQRCTDVALEQADIRFAFDNLSSRPRLSVSASHAVVPVWEEADATVAEPVSFQMYDNYGHFIDRAEIRIFDDAQSTRSTPVSVIDVDDAGRALWHPQIAVAAGPVRELKYVLRAYGADGNFDETASQPLWLTSRRETTRGSAAGPALADSSTAPAERPPQTLSNYGENALAVHNIRLSSGTVRVYGSDVPEDQQVYVAGRPVPVDEEGNFVSEQVLPEGAHTVEVAMLDKFGNGDSYLRDLAFEPNDWFYVGMADLTLSSNSTDGPREALEGEDSLYDYDSSADGRLAFFVNGKFGDKWRLTASADTREGPIDELFSNFTRKTPDALFRRMDPDLHYPTFGDDGTVQELAPTQGKFYARLGRRQSHLQWGNFDVGYLANEIAQVDRGLYGLNGHYESEATTGFGERRVSLDGFAAEPGTVAARQEFRGTGGSLYFLRHQDVTQGSERVRVEVRDRISGVVKGVVHLSPVLDYDIDYLQGNILLAEPLASTVQDDLLVRAGALPGDDAYLVVRYEYAPGFDEIDSLATGAQAEVWINDYVKLGVTANDNEVEGSDSSLRAGELVLRKSADSWLKLQGGQSEGVLLDELGSVDGGFEFTGPAPGSFADSDASGFRADLSVAFDDLVAGAPGKLTLYQQELDAGYSAPGMNTLTDTTLSGGTFSLSLSDRLTVALKSDERTQQESIEVTARELDLGYQLNRQWDLNLGVRQEELVDGSAVVAATQTEGERTDAVLQVGYDTLGDVRVYGFLQDTLARDGARENNGRVGVGTAFRVAEKMSIDSELSTGDQGVGGRVGTNYLHSEDTSLYLNYALETERNDPVLRVPRGNEGTLVSGMKTRLSDSTSVFLENRFRHGSTAYGLTQSAGVNFSTNARWSLGVNTDIGTLKNLQTGAETDRMAAGIRIGYGTASLKASSGVEFRSDDSEQPDLDRQDRETWLFRNNLTYQLTESTRLLGKLNHADSESSLGGVFAGGYTEAVLGFAHRPVDDGRWNTLVKYTYFYNMPTTDQLTLTQQAAQYVQKSHVASVDLTYALSARLSIGGKYAHRIGELSLDREDPQFFRNDASLYVLRADWRLRKQWSVLAETRLLDMPDLDERRQGMLFTLSRQFGDHLQAGVGYNFTDFSSDLTDLSYDHQGVFLNLTGSF